MEGAATVVEQQVQTTPAEGAASQGTPPEQTTVTPEFSLDNVDDSILTKALAKKLGIKELKSLDELKPAPPKPSKEEIATQEEEEDKAAFAWAIGSGKIKKEHYDEALQAKTKSPREISLSRFSDQVKEIDPALTDTDIEELYKDTYYENEAEDSPRRKLAAKRIEREASEYLSKYQDVDSIKDEYRNHTTTVTRQKDYSKAVKETAKTLPREISVDVPYTDESGEEKTATYKVPVDDKIFGQITKLYDNPDMFNVLGLNDPKTNLPEDYLPGQLQAELDRLTAPHVMKEVIKQHTDARVKDLEAKLKGFTQRFGATPGGKTPHPEAGPNPHVEKQRKAANFK